MILGKKVTKRDTCVLNLSTSPVSKIYYFKNNPERWDKKYEQAFIIITRYSCQILMKLEFSGKIREKYSNIIKILKIRAV
jgi:hypothetical protein